MKMKYKKQRIKSLCDNKSKEQAALITISKVEEICKLLPSLANEINWERGVSTKSKDNVKYVFKNGSVIDILAARESTRGQRRNGGIMEEVILINETALNEIIIPTTNVDRNLPDGTTDPEEVINQSQTYITSAGWKNSFARLKRFVGELKPCEPQNEGVAFSC